MSDYTRTITESNFQNDVLGSEQPVLVDFWANWCGPCRAMGPTVDALAEELSGQVHVGKLDVDESKSLARKYEIRSIPTLVLFAGGTEVGRLVGSQTKGSLKKFVEQLVG